MSNYPEIILKKGKEVTVKRQHHWLFSGALAQKPDKLEEGQIVKVMDANKNYLATGFYASGSIMVRMISFTDTLIDEAFWLEKLNAALTMRKNLLLPESSKTNAYRLVHGEGDHLPGLVIDIYGNTAVLQAHHIGIHLQVDNIANALKKLFGDALEAIYDKSNTTLHHPSVKSDGWLWGKSSSQEIIENEHKFDVNWELGQKTGFFIDQRENRRLLENYSKNRKVLNTFCYTGGFSVYALKGGAKAVYSVDISGTAIAQCEKNLQLNGFDPEQHPCVVGDVMPYMQEIGKGVDLIILDPPAFAKNIRSKHNAVQAYKRLNAMAIKQIAPGGIIFTFSCSQVIDRELFTHTITASAMEVGRKVRILHQLNQSPDHPINIFHQETAYLKGLVLYVE